MERFTHFYQCKNKKCEHIFEHRIMPKLPRCPICNDNVKCLEINLISNSEAFNKLSDWIKNQIKYYQGHSEYPAYCMNATVEAYKQILNKLTEI